MVRPERRTRGDLVALALIVVGALVAVPVLWHFGDARAAVSEPATGPAPAPLVEPAELPPSLAEVWRARSGATPAPVVAGSTVVTADGREVLGRDPVTGERRWRYTRDLDLCTVSAAFGAALTAWSKDPRYCSEITTINGDTGRRARQRNGDAERDTTMLYDGSHATALGSRYLETWRSDLVRTTQYGAVPAPVNPNKQPRSGCAYLSAAAAANQIALLERCADGVRLSVLRANPKEAELPDVLFSVVLTDPPALVVATNAQRTAVLLPNPPRLAVYDERGNQLSERPVTATAPANTDGRPLVAETTVTPNFVYWHTARSTIALDATDLGAQWTAEDTLGSGVLFAGRLLLPVPDAIALLDAQTGERLGSTPVDRGAHDGPVRLATAGPTVLEQRGDTLVALR